MSVENGSTSLLAIVQPGSTQQQIATALDAQKDFDPLVFVETLDGWMKSIRQVAPEIVLIDHTIQGKASLDLIDDISLQFPECAIVAILPDDNSLNAQKVIFAGARAFVIQPFTQLNLLHSLRRVRDLEARRRQAQPAAISEKPQDKEPLQILTVYSPRGGVGSSTVAINLALALHGQIESRVLLFEGKMLFGHLGLMLNIRAHNDITDLIAHANNLDDALIEDVIMQHVSGIDVLLSPSNVQAAQGIRPEELFNVVRGVRRLYDFVVIDAGSHLDENTVTLMDLSDRILLVTTPDLAALHDVSRFIQISRNLAFPPGKLLTILNRSGMIGGLKTKQIEAALHHEIFARIPEDNSKVIRSLNRGIPLLYKYPRSPVSRSMREIAKALAEISPNGQEEGAKQSLLPKLRSRLATNRAG